MDVQLYVYDLSNGLARNISAALLGIQVDAVYHTAVVFGGVEYTYDGGIKSLEPGKSMGPPMEIIDLGETNLPMDIIMEYLDSLREIYTAEVWMICNIPNCYTDVCSLKNRRTRCSLTIAIISQMILLPSS